MHNYLSKSQHCHNVPPSCALGLCLELKHSPGHHHQLALIM